MPRPTKDVIQILIDDLTNNVKKADGTAVTVRAGWITSQAEAPIVTITKIGEWCKILETQGMAKEVYADVAVNLWATNYPDLYSMIETCMETLKANRKAHQDIGIVYMVDINTRRIYEPEIAPILQREQIIVRMWWFE
jgi:hypothetical protein